MLELGRQLSIVGHYRPGAGRGTETEAHLDIREQRRAVGKPTLLVLRLAKAGIGVGVVIVGETDHLERRRNALQLRDGIFPRGSASEQIVEARALEPIRETVEKRAALPDVRELFLCHAWADRLDDATKLYNLLIARSVSVWFSEKDIPIGSSFLREIDRGLAKSRVGTVLVTPALLATDQLVPSVHNTTYDALRMVSPLLASRNGLSTEDDSLEIVADKLAELVKTS